jgi:hypothetical protein
MEFFPFWSEADGLHFNVAAIFLHNIFVTHKLSFGIREADVTEMSLPRVQHSQVAILKNGTSNITWKVKFSLYLIN